MVKQGDVIKHKAAMDVAIQVFRFKQDPNTSNYHVQGYWINQGQVMKYSMGIPAEFYIKPEHLPNWLKCAKPESDKIRDEEWVPLV